MKKITLLVLAAVVLTGCWTTIRTVSEPVVVVREKPVVVSQPVQQPTYVTTVTTPAPKVTTVTTFTVTNYNTDLCFSLDLNAVAAAFAESNSVREFEQILNSSRYMINNLDLNRDGWIDYIRVIETSRGYYHTLLLQACVGPSMFQDIATLVAERRPDVLYVEVIGDPYLYGYNYIVRPVFVRRPPMWNVYGHTTYAVWSSPYYYGYYPSYYTQPKPVVINHYQAYVTTYMSNHHYCHHCDYPSKPFYSGYTEMTQSHRRNDYGVQHPDNSFERRVTRPAASSGVSVRNAAQLRTEVEKSSARTSDKPSTSTRTSGTTTATTTKTSTPAKSTTTSTSTRTSGASTRTKTPMPGTTINTRVNKSGTTRTTVKTTDSTGRTTTIKRESGNSSRTSSTSTRTSGTSTRTSGTSTRTSGTRSSQDNQTSSSPRSSRRAR
ncbi:MAG: hypothetical protein IJQ18_02030 [Paludibacteraceae bacterium]|nr:hypothetical protein [Paludibacteraceae bacterium]